MRMLAFLLFISPVVWAEDVVQFDPITLEYQSCRNLGDTTIWLTDPDDLTTPKPGYLYIPQGCATLLPGVPNKYRKIVAGQVVEMDAAEKAIVDLAQQTQAIVNRRVNAQGTYDAEDHTRVLLRAVVLVILDEINVLRAQHSLPPRTKAQARTAILNKINTGVADDGS